jgi:hypothetical protein
LIARGEGVSKFSRVYEQEAGKEKREGRRAQHSTAQHSTEERRERKTLNIF